MDRPLEVKEITINEVGRQKINKMLLDDVKDSVEKRINLELPPVGSIREQISVESDAENGSMHIALKKEYVAEAYMQTFKTSPINEKELAMLLESADNVKLVVNDPDAGETEVGASYLGNVVGRAIGDVIYGTKEGRGRRGERVSKIQKMPFKRGQ